MTRSSLESCWSLFAIVSEHTVKLKWLILNKHNRWFHSSRVKFPLVSMSASWFLVSMYLIWILESKLIRSNNQSSATLWVLKTCLIVGLIPLMIILITASLSSNTNNKASWCEDWTFEEHNQCDGTHWSFLEIFDSYHWQRVSPDFQESESCFQGQKQSDPINREHNPVQSQSSVQRDDFGFCWTVWNWSLFLTHPTYWNKCMTSKNAECSTWCRFWVLKISRKIESWNSPSLHCFAVLQT